MNGTLSDSGIYHHFTWEVPNFFNLPSETGYVLRSSEFRFAGDLYCLRLYPHGTGEESDDDCIYVDIALARLASSVSEKDISYEIFYKSSSGEEFLFSDDCDDCPADAVGETMFYLERSDLEEKKDTCVPDGILTMCCRMRMSESSALSLHGEEEQKGSSSVDKLQSDYKHLLLKGAESDACLVVCGKQFQVHKCVLRSRSSVFEAMFSHETTEKKSGRVVIDDLKPDRFQDFLEYLYTGRVETFSDDNAFELYVAADKYEVLTLKSECVEYMTRNLSVNSVCDVITVALRYHEKDLMALAVEFFKKNLTSIILTAKWHRFLSENCTVANELLIKALVSGKEPKQSITVESTSSTSKSTSTSSTSKSTSTSSMTESTSSTTESTSSTAECASSKE